MENVAQVLGCAKIFYDVVEVAEVPIGWFAVFVPANDTAAMYLVGFWSDRGGCPVSVSV